MTNPANIADDPAQSLKALGGFSSLLGTNQKGVKMRKNLTDEQLAELNSLRDEWTETASRPAGTFRFERLRVGETGTAMGTYNGHYIEAADVVEAVQVLGAAPAGYRWRLDTRHGVAWAVWPSSGVAALGGA
jgi:hypothetical protein